MESNYDNFNNNSKVWIYQSASRIEDTDVSKINKILENFCDSWMAHGQQMKAYAKIFYARFIVFIVDESQAEISGCGIDKSVHIVKEIEGLFKLNMFDRLKIAFINKDNEIEVASKNQISKYLEENYIDENTIVFNNLCVDKLSFSLNWKIAIKNSYLKNLLAGV